MTNPLSKMRQMMLDPAAKWDHLQPPQIARLFLEAAVPDLDNGWAKLTKVAAQDREAQFPAWQPSMLKDTDTREYHNYFPMLMEMNSTEFRCVACRCVPTEVPGSRCPNHGLPQLVLQMEDWYATPALNYLPPQMRNVIGGDGGLWLLEGGQQPRKPIEYTRDLPYTESWDEAIFEKGQSILCVTNPLTKEYIYLPPFSWKLEGQIGILRMVDWDVETDEMMANMEWGSGSVSRPSSGSCSPHMSSAPTSPRSDSSSSSPCNESDKDYKSPFEMIRDRGGSSPRSNIARSGGNKSPPCFKAKEAQTCTGGRQKKESNCIGAPPVKPNWKWNPRDVHHEPPCISCHTQKCNTRFRHPQQFTNTFSITDAPCPLMDAPCPAGCTTNHGHVIPVNYTPPPTHREFARLLDLPADEHQEPWLVLGRTMPSLVPPGYAAPGSPRYQRPLSNQDFKVNEQVILMDESGREVGLGTVWKREVGEHMDNKPLKSYETAVIVTRCITDVDLIWEPNGYFGRLQKKSSVIGSKETGHKNMMCSLPIRWPSSLLLRPPEVTAAMKCQMSTDHIEGRDNPAFGESTAAKDILNEVCDPDKHPTRQNPSSCGDGKKDCSMCSVKCLFATSRRYIIIVMGYRYEKAPRAQLIEDLVVGVYESFFKRWTFKRSTVNRCRWMPEAQGKTEIAILGDDDPRKMAVIFGGLAINVRPGREEVEELFEPTIFYCPLYSRTRRRKQLEFSGRKIDPTNYHNLFTFQMWPPVVVQPFRENGQSAVQAVTRKAVQFPETILVVNVNLDDDNVPTGYFDLLTRMPVDLFQGLLASATMFTPQYIEHSAGEGLICFKAGHNPELVFYDVMWDRWFTAKYPKQEEGVMMKHFQLCKGIWKPSFKQRTGNNDLMLALHP